MNRQPASPEQQANYIASIEEMHEYPSVGVFSKNKELEPSLRPFCSQKAKIFVFGKPNDWRDKANYEKLIPLLLKEGVEKVYVPSASAFTGELSDPSDFHEELDIGGIKFLNGCKTEGLVIPLNSAIILRTADCPTIVYHDIQNDILIVAHAGLGSVVDLKRILTGVSPRHDESVVDNMIRYTEDTEDREVHIVCGISYENFIYSLSDPTYKENNLKILSALLKYNNAIPLGIDHGGISIHGIIMDQFISHGITIDEINLDYVDTFSNPALWSHRQMVVNEEKDYGRNAVLVIHKG